LGERITQGLYRNDLLPTMTAQVSVSVGIALFPEHGREVSVLLKNADSAMYQAKRDGRNQVSFFNPVRHERAAREARTSVELMRAVQDAQPQFFLEYQPQVAMDTNKVVGLEALLRWRHPHLGVLRPDRFIDVAESNGLSERITTWVLNEVCAQIARWRDAYPGFEIPVSINVPGRDFASNALPLTVRAALKRHDIAPSMVVLEVTERTLVREGAVSNDVVAEFTATGVGLVLDDFGTGYSTLSYLRRLPIRAIKIDRSFVKNLPDDNDGKALVDAILGLATHFRLPIVAEGVESREQAVYLQERGCEFAQGYLYSKPLPSERITEHLSGLAGKYPH
jgi:EAL domain-containing protein (putative c-di-GMP-specific phosphodiesterase class I)